MPSLLSATTGGARKHAWTNNTHGYNFYNERFRVSGQSTFPGGSKLVFHFVKTISNLSEVGAERLEKHKIYRSDWARPLNLYLGCGNGLFVKVIILRSKVKHIV